MERITRDELASLTAVRGTPAVSIYMPTHRAGRETEQDPIRLKNLLAEAERQLAAAELRTPAIDDLLAQARALLSDSVFWRNQGRGLALFLNADERREYRLPLRFDERVVVSDHLHLAPLLPLFNVADRFYVLALSQNASRLWQGNRLGLADVTPAGMPQGMAETLRFDDPEKSLQWHTRSGRREVGGERGAMFHGQGQGEAGAREDLLRYLRQVDAAVHDTLRGDEAPLLLAAVDFVQAAYHEVNTVPQLLAEGVAGNPEALGEDALHAQTWAQVQPALAKTMETAQARFRQLAGSGSDQATSELAAVVAAAQAGQVETLFVNTTQQRWGAFEPQTATVMVHETPQEGDEELLNKAAMQTLLHRGKVFAGGDDLVSSHTAVAAILRY